MAYDPADYTYEDWLLDTDDGVERCVHGIDVDSPCEECSPQSIPAEPIKAARYIEPEFRPFWWGRS
jgi:hypothetical protein